MTIPPMPAAPDIISFFLHSEARRCQTGEEATSALRAAGRSITPRRCSATARVSTNAASSAVSPTGNTDFASRWHQTKRRKCSNRVREQNCFVSPDLLDPAELHPFRRYLNQVNQQFKGSTYSIAKFCCPLCSDSERFSWVIWLKKRALSHRRVATFHCDPVSSR